MWIAYYFLLRPGEYLHTTSEHAFRLEDVFFRIHDVEYSAHNFRYFSAYRSLSLSLEQST